MPVELSTGFSLFKTMFDMAKGLKDISDATVRNAAVIELQEKILSAQEQQAALVDSVQQAEAEIVNLKNWDAEKQKYELQRYRPDTLAYVLKSEVGDGGATHKLCANCFDQGNKSLLQATTEIVLRYRTYSCPRCRTNFSFGQLWEEVADQTP